MKKAMMQERKPALSDIEVECNRIIVLMDNVTNESLELSQEPLNYHSRISQLIINFVQQYNNHPQFHKLHQNLDIHAVGLRDRFNQNYLAEDKK